MMKLSEAIRLGALLKRQGFGYFLRNETSCAFGAAMDAIGTTCCQDAERPVEHGELARV